MKLRGTIALALALACSPASAQTNPGTSPLSGAKGGTNNAFMQFAGPATAIKTYTLPNASGTIAVLNAIATWTAVQSFTDGTLVLLGSSSGSSTLKAPATGGGTATLFAGSDTIVGLVTAGALTNKTITSSTNVLGGVTMTLGSDATGDIYYRNASGFLTRLAVGSNTNVLTLVSGLPSWQPGTAAASITVGVTTIGSCGTSGGILYNAAGSLGCAAANGFVTAGSGITLTGTTNVTIAQSLNSAILNGSPANPANLGSVSQQMAGLGVTTCRFTPTYSSRVRFDIFGNNSNNTALQSNVIGLRYGTGAGPANAAAATGTSLGNTFNSTSGTAGQQIPFHVSGYATGLTPGVTVWFDLSVSVSANTATLANLSCLASEVL